MSPNSACACRPSTLVAPSGSRSDPSRKLCAGRRRGRPLRRTLVCCTSMAVGGGVGHHRDCRRGDDAILSAHLVGDTARLLRARRGAQLNHQRVWRQCVSERETRAMHAEQRGAV
eukprot:CAMPEP_0179907914 /NCGR_PEP_ID=MMETSP0982-20121206/44226_1 /TAXON_ID=483367 /ORGANISM="non described non described, Strain CCMP 2436" /LENGTH=114 /DNA_ID=CAMNT_0021808909 /DNA_START=184 /DNA_END=529 /DNA_ORIENTATION=+